MAKKPKAAAERGATFVVVQALNEDDASFSARLKALGMMVGIVVKVPWRKLDGATDKAGEAIGASDLALVIWSHDASEVEREAAAEEIALVAAKGLPTLVLAEEGALPFHAPVGSQVVPWRRDDPAVHLRGTSLVKACSALASGRAGRQLLALAQLALALQVFAASAEPVDAR